MTTETTRPRLAFGLNEAIPDDYLGAAWGARLIYPDDLLFDRQDTVHFGNGLDDAAQKAEIDRLHAWLNGSAPYATAKGEHPLALALKASRRLLRPDESRRVVLYEDATGVIEGDPRASHGYVYIAATLKEAG